MTFKFGKNKLPEIKYPELQKYLDSNKGNSAGENLNNKLTEIRNAVLSLRKSKSMLIDTSDTDSKSCGSFFLNPILDKEEYEKFKFITENNFPSVPVFSAGEKYKISAAWLVENSGFHKGYIKGGVGISNNHSLALINKNGSAAELLSLAEEIEMKVNEKFGIKLDKEPVVV